MTRRTLIVFAQTLLPACSCLSELQAAEIVDHPFRGITSITRTEISPRNVSLHIIEIDLTASGVGFKLTPPGGSLETVRQTTLEFLKQEHESLLQNSALVGGDGWLKNSTCRKCLEKGPNSSKLLSRN